MAFEHVPGNDRVKKTLSVYIRRGMIPASMIFSGPEAAGTLSMALAFAQELNCLSPGKETEFRCLNCTAIEKGIFPDVRLVVPDGQFFKKGQIDELIENAHLKPALAARKVFILAAAHRMNDNAANAFLKTLEEPSPANIFILSTSNLNLLIPTIRSRCQVLKFFPLSQEEIRTELVKRGFATDQARLLSFYPGFSLENLTPKDFEEMAEKRTAVFAMFASLITQNDVEDLLLNLYDRSRSREQFLPYFRETVNILSIFLRDLMVLQVDRQSQQLANADYRQKLLPLVGCVGTEKILFLIRKMEMLLRDVQRNLNSRVLVLEFINSFSPITD